VGKSYEAGGIAKDGAKMVTAVATSKVSNLTLLTLTLALTLTLI
jgi:3-methylcrotonyl-CoA carboxylase beta subunit